jgi:hypothetical protein
MKFKKNLLLWNYWTNREPSNDCFIKILFLLSKWFQTRRFLWEFPIGSYVKSSSAVAAILVRGRHHQTQFWKRTIQGLFYQSLVPIKRGDEIKKKSSPLKLLNQTLLKWSFGDPLPKVCSVFHPSDRQPSWLEVGITRHKFERGPSKDHSTKVWLQLAQWFLRRRFLCEFPIGSYVKPSLAVGAILVKGPNTLYFDKIVIGWSSSKIVSGGAPLWPRWPPQPNLI